MADYVENSDGSITILGFPHKVRMSARAVSWWNNFPAGVRWTGPDAGWCMACGRRGTFRTDRAPAGSVSHECAICGDRFTESMEDGHYKIIR